MLLFNSLANLPATGFGSMHKNFVLELFKMGVDVHTSLQPGRRADIHIQLGQLWDETLFHPDVPKVSADNFVIFAMWESVVLPPDWAEKVNSMADLLIVPSEWNAKIFKDGGVTVPIEVVPCGINPHEFPPLTRARDGSEPFTFLWQGFLHKQDRKGGNLVDAAFMDLIDEGQLPLDDVRLIMKSTPLTLKNVPQTATLNFGTYESRMVETYISLVPHLQLLEILRKADVSINPTSGEGFGLIPLEHMATGLPVFAPCATGMAEYLDPMRRDGKGRQYFELKTKPMDSLIQIPGVEHPGTIDRPYYDDVREKMLWAYKHRKEIIAVGNLASYRVHYKWTYRNSAFRLMEVLAKHFRPGVNVTTTQAPQFSEASNA